jgi:bacillithiol synthase
VIVRSIASEYAAGSRELAPFFVGTPASLFDHPPQAKPWDPALVEALRRYQERLGAPKAFAGDEAVIITGQQPGLFTGPLYTIYKAITAIRAAENLQRATGVPCVPVFWVAGDDHDFEEVRTAHFLTKSHDPLGITYEPSRPVNGLPMSKVPLEPSLHEAIDLAASETRGSELRPDVARVLHEMLDVADSLSDWFARLLARLFADTPLVVFAPELPEARAAASAIFSQAVDAPLATTRLVNEGGKRLEDLGFPAQVVKRGTECSFFLDVDGYRRKVTFVDGRFRLPEAALEFAPEEMSSLLAEAPERFSANVALRCVVQQHLFPVAAYVAGPGETAYWAQLKPVFERFGETMPVVYPRARCVLATAKVRALVSRLGLSMADFSEPVDRLVERGLRATSGEDPALATISERRTGLQADLDALAEALRGENAVAGDMAGRLAVRVTQGMDRIERAVLLSDTAKRESARRQVLRLCHTLAPWRKPQERVYTVFSFLFEHGWDLIPRLLDEMDIVSFAMNEVEL